MNLDQLARRIYQISTEQAAHRLGDLLLDWKSDDSTAEELRDRVERYIGNSWIESDEDHDRVYHLWSAFRDQAIVRIGGMTMNERLCYFSLFDRFDASRDDERQTVYSKLQAVP